MSGAIQKIDKSILDTARSDLSYAQNMIIILCILTGEVGMPSEKYIDFFYYSLSGQGLGLNRPGDTSKKEFNKALQELLDSKHCIETRGGLQFYEEMFTADYTDKKRMEHIDTFKGVLKELADKSSTGDRIKYMMDLLIHVNDKIIIIDTKWYTGDESGQNNRQIRDYLRETAYKYRSDESVSTLFGIVLYATNSYSKRDNALPCKFEQTDRVVDETLNLHLDMRRDFEDIKKDLAERLDDLTTKSPYWFLDELKKGNSIFGRV